MPQMPIIERMFELAREGPCLNITELKKQLSREGYEYVDGHLRSGDLTKRIRHLIRDRIA